jgi:predicted transcriptional regulator
MKIQQVLNILNGELICGKSELLEDEIDYGYSCDLMSDVLAYVQNNVLLLTGLVHPQVIRTAEMLDIKAILIVRGKKPSEDIIDMANERDIVIIRTTHSLFTASGLLFQQGLLGEEIAHDEIHL